MGGSQKFAVLGPGGVGGFLAALLIRSGNDVIVLAGDETARALAAGGLRLESTRFGEFEVPVRTATRLETPVEACLITVKATHLDAALGRVRPDALGDGFVIPFLNGFEHVDRLREVYGPDRVVAATIRIETTRTKTGVIRHSSPFAAVDIAPSAANRDRVEEIAASLRATGIDVRVREDERAMLWDKFAVLAPMALLTTDELANLGVIRERRRDDLVALVHEISAVAAADGVDIGPEAVIALVDSVPASMESSMQRDREAGRPLELDALGGAVLRRAAAHGVPVPVTERLVEHLQAADGGSRTG